MQKFGYTVLLVLAISLSSFAQNSSYYTVLVGTFLDAKAQDFKNLRTLGFLHATKLEGNLTQVFIGGFDKQGDAENSQFYTPFLYIFSVQMIGSSLQMK